MTEGWSASAFASHSLWPPPPVIDGLLLLFRGNVLQKTRVVDVAPLIPDAIPSQASTTSVGHTSHGGFEMDFGLPPSRAGEENVVLAHTMPDLQQ
jgi:hypothetical protein